MGAEEKKMNRDKLTKSEVKNLKYLEAMFPGYVGEKTAGNGWFDFVFRPPTNDSDLPYLHIESKCASDRLADSQKQWAEDEFGSGCEKYVIYTPTDDDTTPCYVYPLDLYLALVENEGIVARAERTERKLDSKGHWFQEELNALAKEHPGCVARLIGESSIVAPTLNILRERRPATPNRYHSVDGVVVSTNLSRTEKQAFIEKVKELIPKIVDSKG